MVCLGQPWFVKNSWFCLLSQHFYQHHPPYVRAQEGSGLPWWLNGKESACKAGHLGSIPGLESNPGRGRPVSLQHASCTPRTGEFPWRRHRLPTPVFLGFPGGSDGKESAYNAGDAVQFLGWEDPQRRYRLLTLVFLGFPGGSDGKESACDVADRFDPWVGKISWRREWLLTLAFLPGKFHGQRSLVGCSP